MGGGIIWVVPVESVLRNVKTQVCSTLGCLTGLLSVTSQKELEETKDKLKYKTIEVHELRDVERLSKIYIYNTNPSSTEPTLKIGYTKDVYRHLKTYQQIIFCIIEMSQPFQGHETKIKKNLKLYS